MSLLTTKNRQLLQKLGHYLTGIIIIMKGIEKAEHFHEHPFIPIFLFVIGAFIIFATFKHHYFEKHIKEFKSLLFFCEGVALALVTYYYFSEGKKLLPSVYAAVSIAYFVMSVVFYRRRVKSEKLIG